MTREFGLVNEHGMIVAVSENEKEMQESCASHKIPEMTYIVSRYISIGENGERITGAWTMGEE